MFSQYIELKDPRALQGSLNVIISDQNRLRRPPSLSESYAWDPNNIERTLASNYSSSANLNTLVPLINTQSEQSLSIPIQSQAQSLADHETQQEIILNNIFRFLFHINLISLFETIFFFFYVSSLEDNGIVTTVNQLINGLVSTCSNFTETERQITNDILELLVNATQIINTGYAASQQRLQYNNTLFSKSWIYVGALSGLLAAFIGIVQYKKLKIQWKSLILENIGLVIILAVYEYMFFTTIIVPYHPITGPEIEQNTVFELQNHCGLF